eukprot:CAMPEP_0194736080 /NCGR_PEP_ID=MMETSP0296-20130528/76104_1 /TAXON_ID=39354 /ORGANISM="Heterosigma akashiwo, Strain CCMP2393" /LENGTH=98 /DNA_ID=CAMNT_0039645523 /DNA_START=150 /DNA_END=442 /DNA_ORIENTATION=+
MEKRRSNKNSDQNQLRPEATEPECNCNKAEYYFPQGLRQIQFENLQTDPFVRQIWKNQEMTLGEALEVFSRGLQQENNTQPQTQYPDQDDSARNMIDP